MTPTILPSRSADHYRLGDVVRSEWTKFTSLRSSRWTLGAFAVTGVVLGVVISAVWASHWPHLSAHSRANWDPTNNTLAGLIPSYLVIPFLGVLMMSSEYGCGSNTFDVRCGVAAAAGAGGQGHRLRRRGVRRRRSGDLCGLPGRAEGDGGRPPRDARSARRALVLSGAFLALMGLFGLGLGAIIRRSAWAIAAYAGLVLVLPMVLRAFPGNPWRFGPLIILGNSEAAVRIPPGILSPWTGFAVMALYTAVALVAGGVLLVARDA